MDDLRTKLMEDLAGALQGEVRCDPLTVSLYATDASLYQVRPLGVVSPRHRDDVVTVLKYCSEQKIPVIPRGAGTGVAGESLGPGLILDFSRHMRQIEWVGPDTVRVQPGVVLNQLNRVLRQFGRYFPPDPSGASVTTVGSMLALDAAGSHSVRVGSTRDHVQSIEVVLAGGDCFEAGEERLTQAPAELSSTLRELHSQNGSRPHEQSDLAKKSLVDRLAWLLHSNAALINRYQPPMVRNRCGYLLRGALDQRTLRLARMLVGSEGTLAAFTAATLHTMPLPAHRGVALLLFGKMDAAMRAVQAIAPLQPSATDLLDRRLLSLARESDLRFADIIPLDAEAALIIEQTGFSAVQIQDRLRQVIECIRELPDASFAAYEAYDSEEVDFFWSLPERVVPLLTRMQGPTRALPFVEDLAVPPEAMQEFVTKARVVLQKHRVTNSFYAHAAAGQIHIRPFLEWPTPANASRLEDLARDLYQSVFEVGGTISGEHGVGLSRSAFVRDQYGPLYDVFRQVKDLFDPQGLLNPGKILTDDPHLMIRNLRPPPVTPAETVTLQLQWNAAELLTAAARCNGCGHCRTQEPGSRMCPLFRLDPSEEASPRAKANLIRDLASGTIPPDEWTGPEFKRIADLCVNCKQCQLECPSSINVPHMMIEAKAAYVLSHGLSGTDWLLSRAHSFGALGTALASPVNWLLGNPVARWFLEKMVGIARQRKLPPFAKRTFLRTVRPELLQRPVVRGTERPVVYFVDHYVNYHDPELGMAFVEILRHNGIQVYVPPNQVASGMAMVSAGDLEGARDVAEENLRELAELARDGCSIVCTEPAAALCLKQEYPMIHSHPDARLVASRVMEAGAFLAELHRQKRLRTDFQKLDLNVGYHTPCHLKALENGTPLADLLEELVLKPTGFQRIERGCSGMAGAYGLSKENFRASVQMGWGLISRMRAGDLAVGVTECSSCKIQMEQGTTVPTLHPLKLLALAYGLMPHLKHRLQPSRRELLVT